MFRLHDAAVLGFPGCVGLLGEGDGGAYADSVMILFFVRCDKILWVDDFFLIISYLLVVAMTRGRIVFAATYCVRGTTGVHACTHALLGAHTVGLFCGPSSFFVCFIYPPSFSAKFLRIFGVTQRGHCRVFEG